MNLHKSSELLYTHYAESKCKIFTKLYRIFFNIIFSDNFLKQAIPHRF